MRLYLINPCNPLVGMVKVKESRWNRYTVWKPLGLLILAALTPVLAENVIRPIGALFGAANGSGILPLGTGMDWFVG